jgi:hypothetical protein
MVLYGTENCNKVMTSYDYGVLAYSAIQYNHDVLRVGAVQRGQIVKNLQIRFILC